ncbi:MAG: hypothetical protein U1F43_36705 [Myxococcota bacterium]
MAIEPTEIMSSQAVDLMLAQAGVKPRAALESAEFEDPGERGPESKPPVEGTMSFGGAPVATLHANRSLRARVKVNSTRQGTPRPFGPWTPGFVAKAADTKSNEVEVEPAQSLAGSWPPVAAENTMEYTALAALARSTLPLERQPMPRVPRYRLTGQLVNPGAKPASPAAALIRDTRPIGQPEPLPAHLAGAPQTLVFERRDRDPFARPRVNAKSASARPTVQVLSPQPLTAPAPSAVEHSDHRFEAAVALVLFLVALGLVHLIWVT